ncbi:fungal specific transcription factor domain-containing protein [Colletotrichum simmondsii]|uniref:Fungal specific transcription factor domain-containing protein n=1 Tax=Colletotrichum simmondsii TaxID=703756 RepID=A0A135SFL8_9PEZI|nr:fungal specific transcription factor domain-containing protein [Colletotrichum simmondsii]
MSSSGATGDNEPAPPQPSNLDSLSMAFPSADQACKECRRRKAKCNRAIPTCNLHLTEVEERLERAEAIITQMRAMMPAQLRSGSVLPSPRNLETSAPRNDEEAFDFSKLDTPAPLEAAPLPAPLPVLSAQGPDALPQCEAVHPEPSRPFQSSPLPQNHVPSPVPPSSNMRSEPPRASRTAQYKPYNDTSHRDLNLLEAHPTDDFEWDEQETLTNYSASPEAILEADLNGEAIADGMASLAVSERESGYLGVASGAALLRLLEPSTPRRRTQSSSSRPGIGAGPQQQHQQYPINHLQNPLIAQQPDPNRHITDAMIDAYFRLYHVSYPIIHEATFRAQYAGVIPRPSGDCWLVLAYTVAAIGVYTTAANLDNLDTSLFAQARSILSFNFLEVGNLTLVQALTLISNYQQKRDKPNSGYNYLGLAVRMAMGLGLHKEFQGWNISPLNMEIRRRVWWSLCVFDVGATITFSRPSVWPYEGVEVSLPLNVDDKVTFPIGLDFSVRTQASFHIATTPIYTRVISKPLPSPDEMLRLDEDLLEPWLASVPSYFSSTSRVPPKYALAHAVMNWRYRNLRIIMYRPFVIRRALQARDRRSDDSPDNVRAFEKCLAEAKATITSISEFWQRNEHNRLGAWYALYFLFQAALIPCICLRNDPASPNARDWQEQITTTTRCIAALAPVNSSSSRCYQVIIDLCGRFLHSNDIALSVAPSATARADSTTSSSYENNAAQSSAPEPIDESPQTQINSVFSMMWPNVPPLEAADVVMGDDAWMEFLKGGTSGDGDGMWFGS